MMSFKPVKYIHKVHQMATKVAGVSVALYEVRRGPGGQIQCISPNSAYAKIEFSDGFGTLHRDESCKLSKAGLVFDSFSFHLQPSNEMNLSIRVDKEPDKRTHANPDPRCEAQYGGHQLCYPEDTNLNMNSFCLLYFLVIALMYRAKRMYPLDDAMAQACNTCIDRIRKQVES